jgi:hypothetical protein
VGGDTEVGLEVDGAEHLEDDPQGLRRAARRLNDWFDWEEEETD